MLWRDYPVSFPVFRLVRMKSNSAWKIIIVELRQYSQSGFYIKRLKLYFRARVWYSVSECSALNKHWKNINFIPDHGVYIGLNKVVSTTRNCSKYRWNRKSDALLTQTVWHTKNDMYTWVRTSIKVRYKMLFFRS